LSIPIPKAMVAAITIDSLPTNAFWLAARIRGSSPAW
jgi:hypothetical protein